MRPCFAFTNIQAADNKPAVLSIYDEIGFWGVQAKDFVAELGKVQGKTLTVEINSPGGDVFAALAMYNALRASGKEIVAEVMGVAASAASLIFMAGDKRVMPKNTHLMVHNPWSFAAGNADELRETAETLDKIGASLKATYAARSGMKDEDVAAMLAKDTWLSADESLEMGLATEVIDEVKAQAKFDMARADLPAAVAAVFATTAPEPETQPDADDSSVAFGDQVVAMASAAGFQAFAAQWVVKFDKVECVQAAISTAREIKALCGAVNMADRADTFIKQAKSIDEVRASLTEALAKADENTHVDTAPRGSNQPTNASAQSAVKTAEIWAKRRSN